jgi:hypothetical protein
MHFLASAGRHAQASNFGRRSFVNLCENRIEAAQAAKTRAQSNLGHRQFRLIEQAFCPLNARCPGELRGTRSQVFLKQAACMARAYAKLVSQIVDAGIVKRAALDQLDGSRDG